MPELCEVQIMTENLERWMVGQRVCSVEVVDDRLAHLQTAPIGAVNRVWRRAKYSVVELDDVSMVIHYRMTGQVVLEDESSRFVRVRWKLESGQNIGFMDPRKFGTVDVVANEVLEQWFKDKKLGQEIWPTVRDGEWWEQIYSGVKSPLKTALLKQDRVVGIGNIMASEFCFAAVLSPFQATSSLTSEDWSRFATAAHERIEAILREERADKIGFLFEGAKNPDAFQLYGREGEPCPLCSTPIQKVQQSGRATYFCSKCQSVNL